MSRPRPRRWTALLFGLGLGTTMPLAAQAADGVHALTAFGLEPIFGPEQVWSYVDPDAPGGGAIRLSTFGAFDTLNGFSTRGDAAPGMGLTLSQIGSGSAEETSVIYGELAESFTLSEDRSELIIRLKEGIFFHDGEPITAQDVVFTFDTLVEKALPVYRVQTFQGVAGYEAVDERTVRVTFTDTINPELPIGIASLPVLPEHYWRDRDFDRLTLEPPLGSGPYRVSDVQAGQFIEFERVPDWWGADQARNQGSFNFERIRFDVYRDNAVRHEAIKSGAFDYLTVSDPKEWAQGFNGIGAVDEGLLRLEVIENKAPARFTGIFFNTRVPRFQDVRVRKAIAILFDFEALNRLAMFDLRQRTVSMFQNSEFQAQGAPEGRELEILEQFRGRVPDDLFTEVPTPPVTDGSGRNRAVLREAGQLLDAAGWPVQDGKRTHAETGEVLSVQIVYTSDTFERFLLPYRDGLARAGIEVELRRIDPASWVNIYRDRQYDMLPGGVGPIYPPGSEMRDFFGSATADFPNSQNVAGIADPVLDEMIELVVNSQTWEERVAAGRVLDRYMRSLWLFLPLFHDPEIRVAHWDMLGRPETVPRFGTSLTGFWWFDPSNTAALPENR